MESDNFKEYMKKCRPLIEKRMHELIEEKQLVELIIGGKCLRGSLCMFVASKLARAETEVEAFETSLDLACAVEITHAMSLVVDDAIDDDETRRGKPSEYKKVGYKKAMLRVVGGLSYPYSIGNRYGAPYVDEMAETLRGMATGALTEFKDTLKEISLRALPATAFYHQIIAKKTGLLFGLSAQYGAMAATNDEEAWRAARQYGLHVGKVMQIADDVHDMDRLLFKCLTVDDLVKELAEDLMKRSIDPKKATELWSNARVAKALKHIMEREFSCVEKQLDNMQKVGIHLSDVEWEQLKEVPLTISRIMLRE